MQTSFFFFLILATALPSLRISPRTWFVAMGILTIALSLIAFIVFYIVYIQSIGSDLDIFSELFIYSLVPVKPADDEPSRRLTKAEREKFSLTPDLMEILVGLLLGDLHARIWKGGVNTCLMFKQGIVNKDYIMHLYEIFSGYCSSGPKLTNAAPDKRTGVVYTGIYFNSYSLPCFNALYSLFYLGGVKIVPLNIFELLTPLGLAYFICDDGSFDKSNKTVKLCTENFTEFDVDLLIQVLENKFNLECRKEKRGKGFRIVIKNKSLGTLRELVCPHLHSSMLHKLGL